MAPNTDSVTRALIISLKSGRGKTTLKVSSLTGISPRTIDSIYARAIKRGFDPLKRPLEIRPKWVEDTPRSGRLLKQTVVADQVTKIVRLDRYSREKSCTDITGTLSQQGFDISATSIWRILRTAGFKKTKPTRKPGLTKKMKKDRLNWCLEHQDWTIED